MFRNMTFVLLDKIVKHSMPGQIRVASKPLKANSETALSIITVCSCISNYRNMTLAIRAIDDCTLSDFICIAILWDVHNAKDTSIHYQQFPNINRFRYLVGVVYLFVKLSSTSHECHQHCIYRLRQQSLSIDMISKGPWKNYTHNENR